MAVTTPAAPRRELFEPEHDDYRESFRRFLQAEVLPHYAEWEAAQLVPRELFTRCAEHGFLAIEVPEELGGHGVSDWRFHVVLNEEAVRARQGDGMAGPLLHSDVVLPYLMNAADDEQRARWLPAVAAGATRLALAMTCAGLGSERHGVKSG